MTDREREIFRTDRPVDVQGLGDYLKGMTLDLNAYNNGKAKGIMFKQASSPSMQRLQNAIHKLAVAVRMNDTTMTNNDHVGHNAFVTTRTADTAPFTANKVNPDPGINPMALVAPQRTSEDKKQAAGLNDNPIQQG